MKFTQFPRKAWVLQPSFRPKEVTLLSHYSTRGKDHFYQAETGKVYHEDELSFTRDEALIIGEERLLKQQADLDKKQAALDKRKLTLATAKGKTA